MHVVGPEERPLRDLVRLEEIEHLEHGESLCRRQRLVDRDTSIAARDRLTPPSVLRAKVGFGEEPTVLARERREVADDLAPIEPRAAAGRDRLDAARKSAMREARA